MNIKMNRKRTLATLISASLLTLAAAPVALAGDPTPAVDHTANHAAAMQQPESDMKRHVDNAQKAVSDNWIQGKLEASFMADHNLSSFAINTEVKNGVATLTGTVETQADIDRATQVAKSIKGITVVKNSLVVEPVEIISKT